MTPEEEKKALENWRPPDPHTILFKRRVYELEVWVESQHRFVEAEEIIALAMRRFNVDRPQGRKYLAAVVEDFKKAHVPVI